MLNGYISGIFVPGLVLIAIVGCAGAPSGPAFQWAPTPPEHRGRVYLYRTDTRNSMAVVQASIGGQSIGTFRNHEYETLELPAGSHRLRAGMRGLGFLTLGWNEHRFRLKAGEIVFLHLDVRIDGGTGVELMGPRELEIGGRSDHRVTENVFIGEQTRSDAISNLEISTRLGR